MWHLILSDMHGNWDAFSTVLGSVRDEHFDSVLVLGDLVGYGASPHRIIDRVRRFGPELTIVRGNHDKVVAGLEEGLGFNRGALTSIRWTRSRLGKRRLAYLADLPQGPAQIEDFLICHGSPADEDLYILNEESALRAFADTEFALAFFAKLAPDHEAGLKNRGRRNQPRGIGFDCRAQALAVRFVEQDGDDGRGVDDHQRGTPCSS